MTRVSYRWLSRILLVLLAPLAHASVELSTSVQKVVPVLDESGQVVRRLEAVESVVPEDVLHYTITFTNAGEDTVDAGSIVITNPLPAETVYLDGSAFGSGTDITFSVDGGKTFAEPGALMVDRDGQSVPAQAADYTTIRWVFKPALDPGQTGDVTFDVRLK